MSRLTDTVRAALGYWWNLISDAARIGFTITDTVQLANQVATDLGGRMSMEENRAISTLYAYARREINAGNAMQAATPAMGITAEMISVPPYARDVREQAVYPMYHVKFQYTYLDASGERKTGIRTSVFPDRLPASIGDLTAAILDDAEGMAAKYGHTLLSATPLNILAV